MKIDFNYDMKKSYIINAMIEEMDTSNFVKGEVSDDFRRILTDIEGANEIYRSILSESFNTVVNTISNFYDKCLEDNENPPRLVYSRCIQSRFNSDNCILNCDKGPQVCRRVVINEVRDKYYELISNIVVEMIKICNLQEQVSNGLNCYLLDMHDNVRYHIYDFEQEYLVPKMIEDGSFNFCKGVLQRFR